MRTARAGGARYPWGVRTTPGCCVPELSKTQRTVAVIRLRPTPSAHYLPRPRLLARLPDTPGHVVVLEAPYGYGKSVLAAQWADDLETHGWRVVWLALTAGGDPRAALADQLELPAGAPWSVVLDALGATESLLVVEDVDAADALTPLLARVEGLLLIAARERLVHPALPLLRTERRLTRLTATDLAFQADEASALFDDPDLAERFHRRTQGWPLPLHFASLTGETPGPGALVEGMRASLAPAAWHEALLLAALPEIPESAMCDATHELARSGFAQRLQGAARLHPLVAEALAARYGDAIREVVAREAERLPPLLRGASFERAGLPERLAALLERVDDDLDRHDPGAVVRWDALAPGGSDRRDLVAGSALGMTGSEEAALQRLERAAASPALPADLRLRALGDALWFSATTDPEHARALVEKGEALLDSVDAERAGRFLNNVSYVDFAAGDFQAARDTLLRALAIYPRDSRLRFGPLTNLAVLDWNLHGDLDQRMHRQQETLEEARRRQPDAVAAGCRDLARAHMHVGDSEQALAFCREAQASARPDPLAGLEAQAMEAFLLGSCQRFPAVLAAARRWSHAYTTDAVGFYWLRCLRLHGGAGASSHARREAAAELERAGAGPLVGLEVALLRAEQGDTANASASLASLQGAYPERDYRLFWAAARYLVSHDRDDLAALLDLTLVGSRVLPGLLPLDVLPPDRPELALPYPLEEVLASGWSDAVALRIEELPPLQVRLLGAVEATGVTGTVELTRRQREIVALSALGHDRAAIGAALWPELAPAKVRNNLSVQWALLRKALEPWGVRTYVSESGLTRTRSDLDALHEAIELGDAASAARLYRPPLAPGIDLAPLTIARGQLHRGVVELLVRAGSASTTGPAAEDDPTDGTGLAFLERALELEPLHEPALQQLLLRLTRLGRRREARSRLDAFARRLADETGLTPLPETVRALERDDRP